VLTRLEIQNFRSVKAAKVEFGAVTVFYGDTASGKSSIFYSLGVLRNLITNPNQAADGLFNMGFQDLGGFDECVFDHRPGLAIDIRANFLEGDNGSVSYGIGVEKAGVNLSTRTSAGFEVAMDVPLPYPVNQTVSANLKSGASEFTANWNGIAFTSVSAMVPSVEQDAAARQIMESLNRATERIRQVEIAPHRRGFFKPYYTPSQVGASPWTEDEIASIIINEPYLSSRISTYTTEIVHRDFRTITQPGTSIVRFQTTDLRSRTPIALVNEGYGINQLVYLLAIMLRPGVDTIMIEEPEVHLHNSVISEFARACSTIVHDEGKQLMFTTHSKDFITALLAGIVDGRFKEDEVRFIEVRKDKRTTVFTPRDVNDHGQLEGGLSSLSTATARDLETLVSAEA